MKIQLVLPYCDNPGSRRLFGWPQPLGILSIATFIKTQIPDIEVEILDGSVLSQEEIESKISADYVGITTILRSYPNALRIASRAKDVGAKVVIGGPYATALGATILLNQPCIDVAVRYDGEIAFTKYVKGLPLDEIENLVYRNDGVCRENPIRLNDLDVLPITDRTILDLSNYQRNFRKLDSPFQRPGTIYSQRGCYWRSKPKGGCIFCAIPDYSIRVRKPISVWTEVQQLYDLGFDFLYDVTDDIGADKTWLRQLLETKPSINMSFMHFLSASHTDDETVDLLLKIGSIEAFIGFESFNHKSLLNMNKEASIQENSLAAQTLNRHGLPLVAGFICGVPGETKESLARSVEFARYLSELPITKGISWNIFKPLPGSRSFEMLLAHPVLGVKYRGKDLFDMEEMKKDWVNIFCEVDYEELCIASEEVHGFAPDVPAYTPKV